MSERMMEEIRRQTRNWMVIIRTIGATFGVLFLWIVAHVPSMVMSMSGENYSYSARAEFWIVIACFAAVILLQIFIEAKIWSEEECGQRFLQWVARQKESSVKLFFAMVVIIVLAPRHLVLTAHRKKIRHEQLNQMKRSEIAKQNK